MPDWPQARLAVTPVVEAGLHVGRVGSVADELRQLVRDRRRELGLSYQSLAVACVESGSGATVSTGWLHRLETGAPVVAPPAETLAALAAGLRLEPERLREAAAAQFFGLRLPWEASGEAAQLLDLIAVLPDNQRRALLDLVKVMATGH